MFNSNLTKNGQWNLHIHLCLGIQMPSFLHLKTIRARKKQEQRYILLHFLFWNFRRLQTQHPSFHLQLMRQATWRNQSSKQEFEPLSYHKKTRWKKRALTSSPSLDLFEHLLGRWLTTPMRVESSAPPNYVVTETWSWRWTIFSSVVQSVCAAIWGMWLR